MNAPLNQPSESLSAFMRALLKGNLSTDETVRLLNEYPPEGLAAHSLVEACREALVFSRKLETGLVKSMDTCGTGGDGLGGLNVSTLSALVCAAAGVSVVKHGNRAITSQSGSADILDHLGIRIDLSDDEALRCLKETHFVFLWAPKYHPAMKHAQEARKRIPGKTVFNLMGPLLNPARATHQLVGVFDEKLVKVMGEALVQLGARRVFVVHGLDGTDEISLCAPTRVYAHPAALFKADCVTPESFGFKRARRESLRYADKAALWEDTEALLDGRLRGSQEDFVVLNAGFCLWIAEAAPTPEKGIEKARELLRSGAVRRQVESIKKLQNQLAWPSS